MVDRWKRNKLCTEYQMDDKVGAPRVGQETIKLQNDLRN